MSQKPQPAPDTVITIQLKDSGEALEQSGTLLIKRGEQAVLRAVRLTTADDLTACILDAARAIQVQERAAAEKAAAAKAEKAAPKKVQSKKADKPVPDKPVPAKPIETKAEKPADDAPLQPALASDTTQLTMF